MNTVFLIIGLLIGFTVGVRHEQATHLYHVSLCTGVNYVKLFLR